MEYEGNLVAGPDIFLHWTRLGPLSVIVMDGGSVAVGSCLDGRSVHE